MKTLGFILVLFSLAGCTAIEKLAEKNDTQHNTFTALTRPTLPAPIIEPDAVTREEFTRGVESIKAETQSSNNAIQQGMNALVGATVAKVAEKVEANAVKATAEFNTNFKALADLCVKIHADLKLAFNTTMNANAEVNAKAVANLKAELGEIRAEVKALAQAQAQGLANLQAGVGNRTESKQESLSAGRDSSNTEFTKEMRDVIIAAFAAIVLIQEGSRRRAHNLNRRLLEHHLPARKGEKPCEPGIARRLLRWLV